MLPNHSGQLHYTKIEKQVDFKIESGTIEA